MTETETRQRTEEPDSKLEEWLGYFGWLGVMSQRRAIVQDADDATKDLLFAAQDYCSALWWASREQRHTAFPEPDKERL